MERFDAVYATLGWKESYSDEDIRSVIDIDSQRREVTQKSYFSKAIPLFGTECEDMLTVGKKDSLEEMAEAVKQQIIATFRDERHAKFASICSEADGPVTYSLFANFHHDECEAILWIKGVDQVVLETDKDVIARVRKALDLHAKKETREKESRQQDIDTFIGMVSNLDIAQSEKRRLIELIEQYKADHPV